MEVHRSMLLHFIIINCLLYPQCHTDSGESVETVGFVKPYELPAQWVEEIDVETGDAVNMDIFFDRVVMIGVEPSPNTEPRIINTGVLIDNKHVLTSYNPFRKLLHNNTDNIVIAVLTGRRYNKTLHEYERRIEYYSIVCYQQVVVLPDSKITPELWHGDDMRHSPLHDLLVIRINTNLKLLDPNPSKYSFYSISNTKFTSVGPMITKLAKNEDTLGSTVKFASLGFRNKEHMLSYNMLSSREYLEEDDVKIDCDEWMIRDWGHFICIKNEDLYEGIGSGTVLIHKSMLYGIGSFSLKKGNVSILVFTDVRPYRNNIFKICVDEINEVY